MGYFSSGGSSPSSGSSEVTVDGQVVIAGTENGLVGGTQRTFVNNRRQQILAAHDVVATVTYVDAGTKAERITRIDFTSATIGAIIARKDITYTLVSGTKYKLNTITWSVI